MRTWTTTVTLALIAAISSGGYHQCQALLLRPQQPATITARGTSTRPATTTFISTKDVTRSRHCISQRRISSANTNNMVADSGESESSILTGCKLSYFGIPGRGEAIRLALTVGGIDFEDYRVPFGAWPKTKATTPWGTLPVLELADGSELGQSRSILRLVGKHTDLYPNEDPLLAQKVDELMDALEDLGSIITNVGQGLETKEEKQAARLVAVSEGGVVYDALARIDAFIETNGDGNGHAVGNQMTIASILTFATIGRMAGGVFIGVPSNVCDPFSNIQLVRTTVGSHPAVMAWYDARIVQQKSIDKLSEAERIMASCRDM